MLANTRKCVVLATGSLLLLGALAMNVEARGGGGHGGGGHGGGHGGHHAAHHAGHHGGHAHAANYHHVNHYNHNVRRYNGPARGGWWGPGWVGGGYWGPSYYSTPGSTVYVPYNTTTPGTQTIIVPGPNTRALPGQPQGQTTPQR